MDLDQTVVLEVGRLVAEEMRTEKSTQLRAKNVIAFVVLKFNPDTDRHWTVPDPDTFNDLMNRLEGVLMEGDHSCWSAYRWVNMWGRVGLLGLSPSDPDKINAYRCLLESQVLGSTRFTIYPKDALEKKGNISVLLRASFRSFKPEWLPKALLRRSRGLKGSLRLTHVKTYADTDVSRAGASKKGWRLALLQGCPRFMFSLEKYPEEHRFPVGSGHVMIRGGSGREKGQGRGQGQGKGRAQDQARGRGGAPTTGGQQQKDQNQQQPGQGSGRKKNNNYDRSFPAGGLRDMGAGRGRGRGIWASPSPNDPGAPR